MQEQRIEEFKKDLQAVLDKHRATISVKDSDDCLDNSEIEVYIESEWSADFTKVLRPSVEFCFESMGSV